MSSVRRVLHTATFANVAQPLVVLMEEKNAILGHGMQHVLITRCHLCQNSGCSPGTAETQESMTVGGFWAASDIKWAGD